MMGARGLAISSYLLLGVLCYLRTTHAVGCEVIVEVGTPYQTNDSTTWTPLGLYVSNSGAAKITAPYIFTLQGEDYGMVEHAYGLSGARTASSVVAGSVSSPANSLLPRDQNEVDLGVVVATTGATPAGMPTTVTVSGRACNVTQEPVPAPQEAPSQIESGGLTTAGGEVIGLDGQPLTMIGINWFGFENAATMVDGFYAGSDSITLDFATIVYRLQLLGFNAVRLPFSFPDLFELPPKNVANPCTQVTPEVVVASVTDPSVSASGTAPGPVNQAGAPQAAGICNAYVPTESVYARFLFTLSYFAANNFYIIIDNHLSYDLTVLNDPATWISNWQTLMTDINKDPAAASRVLVDILNEPDAKGLGWNAMTPLYLSAMDAVYAINPNALLLIEGCGQLTYAMCWGDGYVTDPSIGGIEDANPFFTEVLTKPYLSQVVMAPHIYPPSISKQTQNFAGQGLYDRLCKSFGYLNKAGYGGHQFPIVIGEFGSAFENPDDLTCLTDFATWLNTADDCHNPIRSNFWWSFNANSGDTKGIVADNWYDVVWQKVQYLQTVGLLPWYAGGGSGQTGGSNAAPAAPPPPPAETPAPVETPPAAPMETPPAEPTDTPPAAPTDTTPAAPMETPPAAPTDTPPAAPTDTIPAAPQETPATPPPGAPPSSISTAVTCTPVNAPNNAAGAESYVPTNGSMATNMGRIFGIDAKPVDLRGLIWTGFANDTILEGLTTGPALKLSRDLATIVQRMQNLGFNAVKLPFSFVDLLTAAPAPAASNCTDYTASEFTASILRPNVTVQNGISPSRLREPVANTPGVCNAYIPNDTTLNRFVWIINFFYTNGFYIVLDNDIQYDKTVVETPSIWIQNWLNLMAAVDSSYPEAIRAIVVELIDTPGRANLRWEASNSLPGLTDLYIAAMAALHPSYPGTLFMIDGTGQDVLGAPPGDGFATDLSLISGTSASDPNPFFRELLTRPFKESVIVGPTFAPAVANPAIAEFDGLAFSQKLSSAFGYFNGPGYCVSGVCQGIAVAISEFYSNLAGPQEVQTMSNLAAYLENEYDGNDGRHSMIGSWFWNGWNTDSLGALLAADGYSILWNKTDYLTAVGLLPWFSPRSAHPNPQIESYVQPRVASGAGAESAPSAEALTAPTCNVTIGVGEAGLAANSTGIYQAWLDISVLNLGRGTISPPWIITLTNRNYIGITQGFGITPTITKQGAAAAQATKNSQTLWPGGTSLVTAAAVVQSRSADVAPTTVAINNKECNLVIRA